MRVGRIPDDGFLLLALTPFRDIGVDRARAELKSGFLSRFAADVSAANSQNWRRRCTCAPVFSPGTRGWWR